jgi:hypothetical protein
MAHQLKGRANTAGSGADDPGDRAHERGPAGPVRADDDGHGFSGIQAKSTPTVLEKRRSSPRGP